jgi:ACS family tartrate transporter-like MFS transporter
LNPTYRKIAARLLPFLAILYLVAFLDRVNISFAALTMNRDLGISDSLFGLAAGMFFLGYFLFEVPSNLILERIGARRWIMILMIVWGFISVATAFVHGSHAYILLRFLLGLAESGFFPGVILYLTLWFPATVRSSIMALFAAAIPLSNLIGAPISAQILALGDFGGLRSWQWLFILEGSPAILLGIAVFFLLPDKPEEVHWLTAEEKREIRRELDAEAPPAGHKHSFLRSFLARPAIYAWSLAYFTLAIGLYGLGFWIPKVLVSHGMTLKGTGWATAAPYLVAIVGMVLWTRRSDRLKERRLHLTFAYLTAGAGFAIAGLAPTALIAIAGFSLAAVGVLASMPLFWSTCTLRLAGPMVAAYIALINAIGNLGGFVGPVVMGWLRDTTHSYLAGLCAMGLCLACGAVIVASLAKPASTP